MNNPYSYTISENELDVLKKEDIFIVSELGDCIWGIQGTLIIKTYKRILSELLYEKGYFEIIAPTIYAKTQYTSFGSLKEELIDFPNTSKILVPFCEPVYLDYIVNKTHMHNPLFTWCTTYEPKTSSKSPYENIHCEAFNIVCSKQELRIIYEMQDVFKKVLLLLGEKDVIVKNVNPKRQFCQSDKSLYMYINNNEKGERMIAAIHSFKIERNDCLFENKVLISGCCSLKLLVTIIQKHISDGSLQKWIETFLSQNYPDTLKLN